MRGTQACDATDPLVRQLSEHSLTGSAELPHGRPLVWISMEQLLQGSMKQPKLTLYVTCQLFTLPW